MQLYGYLGYGAVYDPLTKKYKQKDGLDEERNH